MNKVMYYLHSAALECYYLLWGVASWKYVRDGINHHHTQRMYYRMRANGYQLDIRGHYSPNTPW